MGEGGGGHRSRRLKPVWQQALFLQCDTRKTRNGLVVICGRMLHEWARAHATHPSLLQLRDGFNSIQKPFSVSLDGLRNLVRIDYLFRFVVFFFQFFFFVFASIPLQGRVSLTQMNYDSLAALERRLLITPGLGVF